MFICGDLGMQYEFILRVWANEDIATHGLLLLLDLPGRGRRHRLPALPDMASVVARTTADIADWAGTPLALFGHSFGAVVAIETARALQASGVPLVWVGVSGRPAPEQPTAPVAGPPAVAALAHDVPDAELLRHLRAIGGLPDQIHRLPHYRDHILRLVRGDLRVLASYAPRPDRPPVAAPLTAFGGTDDPWAPPASLAGWARETSGRFQQRLFPGGHFHFLGAGFAGFSGAVLSEAGNAFRLWAPAADGAPVPSTVPS